MTSATFLIHWSMATATMMSTPMRKKVHCGSVPTSAQADLEDADDQRAEEHAEDRAAPAEERDAADHHGGDRLDVAEHARSRPGRDRAEAADQHPAGERAEEAGQRIDLRSASCRRCTPDSSRRLGVVADGVDVAAPGGVAQHIGQDEHQQRSAGTRRSEHLDPAELDRLAPELQQRRARPRCPGCGSSRWPRRGSSRRG